MRRQTLQWLLVASLGLGFSLYQTGCACDPGVVRGNPSNPNGSEDLSKRDKCLPYLRGAVLSTRTQDTTITHLTWSSDGSRFAAITRPGELRIWDSKKRVELRKHQYSQPTQVWALAFGADNQTLLSLGDDGVLRVWTEAGEQGSLLPPSPGWQGRALASGVWTTITPPRALAVAGYVSKEGKGLLAWYKLGAQNSPLHYKEVASPVLSVAFGPEGKHTVVGLADGSLQVWDTLSGQRITGIDNAHSKGVHALHVAPEGRFLASAAQESNAVKIWHLSSDGRNLTPKRTLQSHTTPVTSVAFSSNGDLLASLSAHADRPREGELRLWNVPTSKNKRAAVEEVLLPSAQPRLGGQTLAWQPSSNLLLTGNPDGQVTTWLMEGDPAVGYSPPPDVPIQTIAYSPDDARVAYGTASGLFRIKETRSNGLTKTQDVGSPVRQVLWDPDNSYAIAALDSGAVRFWTIADDAQTTFHPSSPHGKAYSLATRRDRKALAVGYEDGTVIALDPTQPPRVHNTWTAMHTKAITSMDWSHDGTLLATASLDGTVKIWQFAEATERPTLQETWRAPQGMLPTKVTFHPNDSRMAIGLQGKAIGLWHIDTNQWKTFPAPVATEILYWHPNGALIYTGARNGDSKPGSLHAWNASNPLSLSYIGAIPPHRKTAPLTDIALGSNGQFAYLSYADKSFQVWRLRRGRIVGQASFSPEPVSLAVRPDGKQLVAGMLNTTLQIWEKNSEGSLTRRVLESGHQNAIGHIAITDNGSRMFTAAGAQRFQAWDIQQVKPSVALQFPGASSSFKLLAIMTGLALSPDNTTLAVTTGEPTLDANNNRIYHGQLSFWDVNRAEQPVQVLQGLPLISKLAWHPTKKIVVVGHNNAGGATALHKEGGAWKILREYPNLHASLTTLVAFEPTKGDLVASTGVRGYIKLWRLSDGKVLHRLDAGGPRVSELLFHPAGHVIGAALPNGQVKLWRVSDGSLERVLVDPDLRKEGRSVLAHQGPVAAMAWSVNGNTLYTGGNLTIKQWICAR